MLHPIWLLFMGSLGIFVDGVVVMKTTKVECMPNPAFIRNASCSMRPVNWHRTNTNMQCDVVGELRNVSLHLQVFSKNTANRYRPFLVNITRNFCDIMDKKIFPAYATIVTNILREVSNVNHSCPYKGRLIVKNLYVDDKFIPFKLPLGLYKVSFTFLEGYPYQDMGTVLLYFDVTEVRSAQPRPQQPRHVLSDKG